MKIGDKTDLRRSFSREDLAEYAALCGPAGGENAIPEPLIGGLFSYLLGVELPGPGTNYLKQETRFENPAYVGETLIATVEIIRIRPEKHLVDLATTCSGEDGRLIANGRALVYVADTGRTA